VSESPYLTACKEKDGLLGNIEMNHYTNVDDITSEYTVGAGDNLKHWNDIADELSKPGVFDKLARYFKK
jgi:hypothetical protein